MAESTDPRLNGASTDIRLRDKDGKEVTLHCRPMSDRDITEMDAWVRTQFIQMARDSLRPGDSRETRDRVEGLAMDRAFGMSFMSGEGAKLIGTVGGVVRLVWTCCRHADPQLTEERVRDLMFNDTNIREAQRVWRQLNLGTNPTRPAPEPAKVERLTKAPRKRVASKSTASSQGSTGTRRPKSRR